MTREERWIQLLQELVMGIDKGEFQNIGSISDHYTYEHLVALFAMQDCLDGGRELFEQIYDLTIMHGKACLAEKLRRGEKIRIAFLAVSAAEWGYEGIYRKLREDSRFDVKVYVCPLMNRDKNSMENTYKETLTYFIQNDYYVAGTYDEDNQCVRDWNTLGGLPDVILHSTAWYKALPEEYWIIALPLRVLNLYVPYGMGTAENKEGNYRTVYVYDKEFTNLMWKLYADTEMERAQYEKYSTLRGKNVCYSGYPKMDYFFQKRHFSEEELRKIWKIPKEAEASGMKKIVLAPHHSIENSGILFSTFHQNAFFLLYLAQKYSDTISWIFKPHPNLRPRAVSAGLFKSNEEYDAYLEQWNQLPNARVVDEGDYLDIFATSDGMIMDSSSFLAEYLYADKPLLFLKREGQAFSVLGDRAIKVHYQVQGTDYQGIEDFVREVILGEQDRNRAARESLLDEELNYVKKNGCLASEYVYEDLCREIESLQ